jgi:hypothetical protein
MITEHFRVRLEEYFFQPLEMTISQRLYAAIKRPPTQYLLSSVLDITFRLSATRQSKQSRRRVSYRKGGVHFNAREGYRQHDIRALSEGRRRRLALRLPQCSAEAALGVHDEGRRDLRFPCKYCAGRPKKQSKTNIDLMSWTYSVNKLLVCF